MLWVNEQSVNKQYDLSAKWLRLFGNCNDDIL